MLTPSAVATPVPGAVVARAVKSGIVRLQTGDDARSPNRAVLRELPVDERIDLGERALQVRAGRGRRAIELLRPDDRPGGASAH